LPRAKFLIASIAALAICCVAVAVLFLESPPNHGEGEPPPDGPLGESPESEGDTARDPREGNRTVHRAPVSEQELPSKADTTISGKVVDAGGSPLADATVRLRLTSPTSSPRRTKSHTSGPAGRFAFALPSSEEAELSFGCPGYRPTRLRTRAPARQLEVVLERSPSLHGFVIHPDGRPVEAALVRWSNAQEVIGVGGTTTTNASGAFSFSGVPWGVLLEVLPPEGLPASRFVHVTWGMGDVKITIDPGREIRGRVVDALSHAGIGEARVQLWYYRGTFTSDGRRAGPSLLAETVVTSSKGDFTLSKLPSVQNPGLPSAFLWVTASGRAPHWKLVDSPRRARELEVSLYPVGSITGRVVNGSGAPLAGYRVFAEAEVQALCDAGDNRNFRRQDGGFSTLWNRRHLDAIAPFHNVREAISDSAGHYVIDAVPCTPGGTKVTVALPAGRPHSEVIAKPGRTVIAANLVVTRDGLRHWHGEVRDTSGFPVPGASVELGGLRCLSNEKGQFELDLPASIQGRLRLRAESRGYARVDRVLRPRSGIFCECPEEGLKITLLPGFALRVRVLDRQQHAVANASVRSFPAGSLADSKKGGPEIPSIVEALTDAQGLALLEGLPESCDLHVSYPNRRKADHRVTLRGVDATVLQRDVVLRSLDDVSSPRATLSLDLIDARTGKPLEARVLIEARSESLEMRWSRMGPECRLGPLPIGRWDLTISAENIGPKTQRVQLLDDLRLDLRLGEGATLSGRVQGAALAVDQVLQVMAIAVGSGRCSYARAKLNGEFEFAGLPPGEYLISVPSFEFDPYASGRGARPQRFASSKAVRASVHAGRSSTPVVLPVLAVAPLRVRVAPDSSGHLRQSLWAWAQELRFEVSNAQRKLVYSGRPTELLAGTAALELCLPIGRYQVSVRRGMTLLAEKELQAGAHWRLEAR
jgi:hypothetical protein